MIGEAFMNDSIDLDGLTRRTQRLEYEDGLRDFQLGAIFLILGLANWYIFTPAGLGTFVQITKNHRDLLLPAVVGLFALAVLLAFGSERAMERIRRATFWKDSGFVKPLRWGTIPKGVTISATILLLGIIIGSVSLMSTGDLSQEIALRSIPASVGIATGIIFLYMGFNLHIRRYWFVGVVGALLSLWVLLAELSFAEAYLWSGIGWAILFIISGGWALGGALRDLRGEAQNG
jgi:hypothetical protein